MQVHLTTGSPKERAGEKKGRLKVEREDGDVFSATEKCRMEFEETGIEGYFMRRGKGTGRVVALALDPKWTSVDPEFNPVFFVRSQSPPR